MKTAYIMRGLPGSGKSTLAKTIAKAAETEGVRCAIHSTDAYFVVNGDYIFNPAMLREYHQKNQQAFTQSCMDGVDVVICDNTNMAWWEMEQYMAVAEVWGYQVQVILVGDPSHPWHQEACAARNTHGVTLDIIKKMAAKFQLNRDRAPEVRAS